jgi:preprotein translocase subunit SecA
LLGAIKSDVVQELARVHMHTPEELAAMEAQQQYEADAMRLSFQHAEIDAITGETHNDPELADMNRAGVSLSKGTRPDANPYAHMVISRNAVCPCGSGKKYKQCHGAAV